MNVGRATRRTLAGCLLPLALSLPGWTGASRITAVDWGQLTGFQDSWQNHYRRGRSIVAADFDGDGRVDFFIGNVGDPSLILRNVPAGSKRAVRFEPMWVLPGDTTAFVASAADYDNDGDLDLYVGCGGLEAHCQDRMFRNESEPGRIRFSDATSEAGLAGAHATAGSAWGDYDRDGDQDLFLSVVRASGWPGCANLLWRNNGNGTFTNVTRQVNLVYKPYGSSDDGGLVPLYWFQFQNSTWIDADNDGDLDLFVNNAGGPNVLYRNLLEELGVAQFIDATQAFSLPGEDLRFPFYSFSSAVVDLDNDGWQDLVVFAVGSESTGPYGNGNGLFLNQQGRGFFNASSVAGINTPGGGPEIAMGSQVADLDADGTPDLVIGSGNPGQGGRTRLLLSAGVKPGVPVYADASDLIDFEPVHGIDPFMPPYPEVPPFPYRTHGMAAADVDGDGHQELAVVNGGLSLSPPIVREPNRLFRFAGDDVGATFRVTLRGNGASDSRDAVGARAYAEIVSGRRGERRRVYRTVVGSSGFGAQNEPTLTFGLGADRVVSRLAVLWPSGCVEVLEGPFVAAIPVADSSASRLSWRTAEFAVEQGACWTCTESAAAVAAWLDPEAYGCTAPGDRSR